MFSAVTVFLNYSDGELTIEDEKELEELDTIPVSTKDQKNIPYTPANISRETNIFSNNV